MSETTESAEVMAESLDAPGLYKEDKVYWMGIDPGVNGGLACIGESGKVQAVRMPKLFEQIWELVSAFRPEEGVKVYAVIERVGGYTAGERAEERSRGARMFVFGENFGGLEMALTAAEIQYEAITPRVWQKGLGISGRDKNETHTSYKNRLKSKAQRLFPGIPVTLKTCDALLMAEYCKQQYHWFSKSITPSERCLNQ